MGGTNRETRTMNRRALGSHDVEFFRLEISAIHETGYAPVG